MQKNLNQIYYNKQVKILCEKCSFTGYYDLVENAPNPDGRPGKMDGESLLRSLCVSCLLEPMWQSMWCDVRSIASRGISLKMEKRNKSTPHSENCESLTRVQRLPFRLWIYQGEEGRTLKECHPLWQDENSFEEEPRFGVFKKKTQNNNEKKLMVVIPVRMTKFEQFWEKLRN